MVKPNVNQIDDDWYMASIESIYESIIKEANSRYENVFKDIKVGDYIRSKVLVTERGKSKDFRKESVRDNTINGKVIEVYKHYIVLKCKNYETAINKIDVYTRFRSIVKAKRK